MQHSIKSALAQKEQEGIWVKKALQSWSDSLCILGFPPVSHNPVPYLPQDISLSQAGCEKPVCVILQPTWADSGDNQIVRSRISRWMSVFTLRLVNLAFRSVKNLYFK